MYASNAPSRFGLSDLEMAFVTANLFIAGGDLPEITMRIFTLAMLHTPAAMRKAQKELDTVIGRERLPDFDDKNALPYTRALILETQRWRPLSGIGVAHTNYYDDWIGAFTPIVDENGADLLSQMGISSPKAPSSSQTCSP